MASLTKFYDDGGVWYLGAKEAVTPGGYDRRVDSDGKVWITNERGIVISGILWSDFADINGNPYTSLVAFREATNGFFSSDAYPSGRPVKLTASFNRPANILDYAANDHVSSVITPVKQKETITVSGSVKAKQKETMTLTGTMSMKQKETLTFTGTSPVKQKEIVTVTGISEAKQKATVTLTGTVSGTANMTLVGGVDKLITFTTDLNTTAANFVTSWAAYYDGLGMAITAGVATVIFEAKVAGIPFGLTAVTNLTGNLAGTSAPTTANVVAGTANVTGTGGLIKLLTYTTTAAAACTAFAASHSVAYSAVGVALTAVTNTLVFESSTAGTAIVVPAVGAPITGTVAGTVVNSVANVVVGTCVVNGLGSGRTVTLLTTLTAACLAFKTSNVAAYLAAGIVLTNSTNTLVMESTVEGVPFTSPTITNGAGDFTATVAVTQANVLIAQGQGQITLAGGIALPIAFDTTPTVTATNFASDLNKATYLTQNIVLTNLGATLIFESFGDDQPFTAPLLVTSQGDLAGSVAHTVVYVPVGKGLISGLGGLSKEMVFTTDANTTTTNFVASHAAAYLAAGIVLTNLTNTVIFEANVAGVPMVYPVFTNTAGTLAGVIVHTTANATIAPFTFTGNAAFSNGGGGMITFCKIEAPAKFAGQVLTLYIYNDTPTSLVGDNVPFVLDTANVAKRIGRIVVTMDAVINASAVVFGQDASYLPYQCAAALRTLKGVLLVGGAVVAPESVGLFTLSLTVTIQA